MYPVGVVYPVCTQRRRVPSLHPVCLEGCPETAPRARQVNRDGQLKYQYGGLALSATYVIIPKPTPAVACASFTTTARVRASNNRKAGDALLARAVRVQLVRGEGRGVSS